MSQYVEGYVEDINMLRTSTTYTCLTMHMFDHAHVCGYTSFINVVDTSAT